MKPNPIQFSNFFGMFTLTTYYVMITALIEQWFSIRVRVQRVISKWKFKCHTRQWKYISNMNKNPFRILFNKPHTFQLFFCTIFYIITIFFLFPSLLQLVLFFVHEQRSCCLLIHTYILQNCIRLLIRTSSIVFIWTSMSRSILFF